MLQKQLINDSIIYLKFKDGFFIDKENVKYKKITGTIKNFKFIFDSYQGIVTEKLILNIVDGEEIYHITMRLTNAFISLCLGLDVADINEPLTLTADKRLSEKGFYFLNIWIEQNGVNLKMSDSNFFAGQQFDQAAKIEICKEFMFRNIKYIKNYDY